MSTMELKKLFKLRQVGGGIDTIQVIFDIVMHPSTTIARIEAIVVPFLNYFLHVDSNFPKYSDIKEVTELRRMRMLMWMQKMDNR
eukprot:gene30383-40369_t